MNRILEINAEERWVRVQAGVVKDQLNLALEPWRDTQELLKMGPASIEAVACPDGPQQDCDADECVKGEVFEELEEPFLERSRHQELGRRIQ